MTFPTGLYRQTWYVALPLLEGKMLSHVATPQPNCVVDFQTTWVKWLKTTLFALN